MRLTDEKTKVEIIFIASKSMRLLYLKKTQTRCIDELLGTYRRDQGQVQVEKTYLNNSFWWSITALIKEYILEVLFKFVWAFMVKMPSFWESLTITLRSI